MSNYPRDEFDDVPESSARHGVHRATMELPQRSLLPILMVGVAALCVGLVAFFALPRLLDTPDAGSSAPLLAAQSSAAAPASTPEATAAETTAAPSVAPTPSAAPSPTPSPEPTAVVDPAVPVAIYNATGVSGLAARYAATVTTNGWTVSASANWAGQPQGGSVIFYQDATQTANAQALAALLGIPTVLETADLGLPLAVVLGPGA
ncbi:LytR C-terminal domain-containing protein [Specibacter sp. NPDC057265]|uniref:LytR C-terminal domain-containing protein n=1 Tax=Specibacter sp. NPDC057265 TaxID=3346075 RepID=UPI0036410D87